MNGLDWNTDSGIANAIGFAGSLIFATGLYFGWVLGRRARR